MAVHARIQRGGGGGQGAGTPLKNHKNKGFLSNTGPDLSNTGPDPIKNHKATKPAFNVCPSSARHFNGVSLVGQ